MKEQIIRCSEILHITAVVLVMGTLVACGGGSQNSDSEINGATGSNTSGGGNNSGNTINVELSWNPNPGNVDGYAINYGTTASSVNTSAAKIATSLPSFNPSAPSVVFDVAAKFGVTTGDQVCFNIQAYNEAGYTTPSSSACITL